METKSVRRWERRDREHDGQRSRTRARSVSSAKTETRGYAKRNEAGKRARASRHDARARGHVQAFSFCLFQLSMTILNLSAGA